MFTSKVSSAPQVTQTGSEAIAYGILDPRLDLESRRALVSDKIIRQHTYSGYHVVTKCFEPRRLDLMLMLPTTGLLSQTGILTSILI